MPSCMLSPFKVKQNKIVHLLSTMLKDCTIAASRKSLIIEHYNETKGRVYAFDQMCSIMSCSQKTKRWPLCLFYGFLNMAGINLWILYNSVTQLDKPVSCQLALYKQLLTPWLERRSQLVTLQSPLRALILEHLGKEQEVRQCPPVNNKRTNCKICPFNKRRMTTNYYTRFAEAQFGEHRGQLCVRCCERDQL